MDALCTLHHDHASMFPLFVVVQVFWIRSFRFYAPRLLCTANFYMLDVNWKKKQNHLGFKGGGGNFLIVINHWALKKNQLDEAKSSTIPRAWSLETGTKHAILASCALRPKKSFKMFLLYSFIVHFCKKFNVSVRNIYWLLVFRNAYLSLPIDYWHWFIIAKTG